MPSNPSKSKSNTRSSSSSKEEKASSRRDVKKDDPKVQKGKDKDVAKSRSSRSSSIPSAKDSNSSNASSKPLRAEKSSSISHSNNDKKLKEKSLKVSSKPKPGESLTNSRNKSTLNSLKKDDFAKLPASSRISLQSKSSKSIKVGESKKKDPSKDTAPQISTNKSSRDIISNAPSKMNTGKAPEKLKATSLSKQDTKKVVSKSKEKEIKEKHKSGTKKISSAAADKEMAVVNPIIRPEKVTILPEEKNAGIILEETQQENLESANLSSEGESRVVDPAHNSLETLESGISMTSPHDLSDAEVEESFSSRLVEVDEMEVNDFPSLPTSIPQNQIAENVNGDDTYLHGEPNYEEDFEDYESDFENDDDDEKEEEESEQDEDDDEEQYSADLEGTNPEIEEIVKAIEAENNRSKVSGVESQATFSTGIVDDSISEPKKSILKTTRPKTGKAFVNFTNVKERARVEKASEKLKNRGQILQEMIQLDTISIEFFTQLPDSYEAYISVFGNANSIQVSVQTNEDDLSESVQTDNPQMLNKWTQHPVSVSSDIGYYSGVGGDMVVSSDNDPYSAYLAIASDSGRLTKFLDASSQVILQLLEEDSTLDEESNLNAKDNTLGFSKLCISLGSGILSLLQDRICSLVAFCPSDSSLIVTGHGFRNNNLLIQESRQTDPSQLISAKGDMKLNSLPIDSGALICLWSIHQPSFPKIILCCRSPALVCCFSPKKPVVVIAGLQDGSLSAWDLREGNSSHPLIISSDSGEWRLRPPSFITACSPEDATEGSQIVSLQTLLVDDETYHDGSFQIASLSSCGQLTWWVLVQESQVSFWGNDPSVASHLGAAPWSKIALSRATTLSLADLIAREEILGGSTYCYDMKLAKNDPNLLYVATANGNVLHCSRHNVKVHPSLFTPSIGPGPEAVSISVCPHDPQYFLVGGSDGLIRLHSVTLPNPLTCWQASTNPAPIKIIKWSQSRPCVFYMLDYLGMFHIWDLSAGDIYPTISVEEGTLIDGTLVSFDLTLAPSDDNQHAYAVFASDSGKVGIRTISAQYLRKNEEEYNNELHRFKCYVNII